LDLVLDHVSVSPGHETALGAALGDDLTAALETNAAIRWRMPAGQAADAPALPEGAEALADHVKAPPELALRLRQIGVVDDAATGEKLAHRLRQGQRLVSRDGGLWRWDGFVVAPGTPTAAATRLAQRNRLDKLIRARAAALAELEGAKARFISAETSARATQLAEQQARDAARQANAALAVVRSEESARARAEASDATRLQVLNEEARRAHANLAQDEARLEAARMRLAAMPDSRAQRDKLAADRGRLSTARANFAELQGAHARLAREAEIRAQRIAAIGDELAQWTSRAEGARRQIAALADRHDAATAEQDRLARRPGEIAAERDALFGRIEEAEARRRAAADRLSEAEARVAAADRALKAIEGELAAQREERVRAEALSDQAMSHLGEIAQAIRDRLDCAPEDTLAVGGLTPESELPAMQQIANRLERLTKERDTMGPVNLRAEQEAAEVEQQLATMRSEKEDLVAAIARLRHGIASLNREGRERLLAAFANVNKHFQDLFTRLFGGGRAHLALAIPTPPAPPEGEAQNAPTIPAPANDVDPLEAGLEVMASPPGKKLQSLSLLSGGEQALTALALLFAVFLTNPAPICVLDEVDAPLDDAKVDRFCTLLEDTARTTGTRFLLVTHHRLTMARMHRLFGVTMAERGISQIVSVDLRGAERIRATA
jgi:chromosome segregation protein